MDMKKYLAALQAKYQNIIILEVLFNSYNKSSRFDNIDIQVEL